MSVGLVYDPIYLEHDTGTHPENKQRLVAITNLLEKSGLSKKLTSLAPTMATPNDLLTIHSQEHISRVKSYSEAGGWLDGDTVASPGSYKAAFYAAGGLIRAVEAVLHSEVNSAFALVRPPGHHATRQRAMGFCLFNNIAIAAKYAKLKGLDRVLIADFDIHHGNGTQEAFYNDPTTLYFSTHQYPFYPGTGAVSEIGEGDGKGTTINVPLPAGCGDEVYYQVYQDILPHIARRFQPQLILVSAGYDSHRDDPIGMMELSTSGFSSIVRTIKGLADDLCQGKLAFTLEGGYNLEALSHGVKATLDILLGNVEGKTPLESCKPTGKPSSVQDIMGRVKKIHKGFFQ